MPVRAVASVGMTDTFTARVHTAGEIGDSADFVEVSYDQVPRIGEHGELIVVERGTPERPELTRVYSPHAWISYAYPTGEPSVAFA